MFIQVNVSSAFRVLASLLVLRRKGEWGRGSGTHLPLPRRTHIPWNNVMASLHGLYKRSHLNYTRTQSSVAHFCTLYYGFSFWAEFWGVFKVMGWEKKRKVLGGGGGNTPYKLQKVDKNIITLLPHHRNRFIGVWCAPQHLQIITTVRKTFNARGQKPILKFIKYYIILSHSIHIFDIALIKYQSLEF